MSGPRPMPEGDTLTKAAVARFLANPEASSLAAYKAIDESDGAIQLLATLPGKLDLSGIQELSHSQAESLRRYAGEELDLSGLKTLTPLVAIALWEGSAQSLVCPLFDTFIEDRDAAPPSAIPNDVVDFRLAQLFSSCPDTSAMYLASARKDAAAFYGELGTEDARRLAGFNNITVCLNGWYSISSTESLEALCRGEFSGLSLRLDALTTPHAEVLAGCKSRKLALESAVVDRDAARTLLDYPGEFMGMRGVRTIFRTSEANDIFSEHPSMAKWGEVAGLETRVSLRGTCWACGTEYCEALSVSEIRDPSGCAGLKGLLNDRTVEVPGIYYTGSVCDACFAELGEADRQ